MCRGVPRLFENVKCGKARTGWAAIARLRVAALAGRVERPTRACTRTVQSTFVGQIFTIEGPASCSGMTRRCSGRARRDSGSPNRHSRSLRRDSRARIRDSRRRNRCSRIRILDSRSRAGPSLRRNCCSLKRNRCSRKANSASRRPSRDSGAAPSYSRTAPRASGTANRDSGSAARCSRRPWRTSIEAIPLCIGPAPIKRMTHRTTRAQKSRPKAACWDSGAWKSR